MRAGPGRVVQSEEESYELPSVNCLEVFDREWKQAIYDESYYAYENTDFTCDNCEFETLEDWTQWDNDLYETLLSNFKCPNLPQNRDELVTSNNFEVQGQHSENYHKSIQYSVFPCD